MKYIWLLLVAAGIAGAFLGYQRYQVSHTEAFGEYPCFPCASVAPDFEIIAFSSTDCPLCDQAVQRIERFCRLTGVTYGSTYYDGSQETVNKLSELGLEKTTDFLVVIVQDDAVIKTSINASAVESFLSETLKEVAQI